jgi:hypothetical protein
MITQAFLRWANQPNRIRRTGIKISLPRLSDGALLTLKVADSGGEIDGMGNWHPCVQESPTLSQSLQEMLSGQSRVSYGTLKLALDDLARLGPDGTLRWDNVLTDYAWAGAAIQQVVGGDDLPFADWATCLTGFLGRPTDGDAWLTAPIYSARRALSSITVPPNVYDSSVPSSSQGKVIPIALGPAKGITPVLISDGGGSGPWVYQYSDPAFAPTLAVDAVYIDSILQTAGFTPNLTNNTVSFSSKPSTAPTLDVRGAVYNGVYLVKLGDIIKAFLQFFGGLSDARLDLGSFALLGSVYPHAQDAYLTSAIALDAFLDDMCSGQPVIWRDNREGVFRVQFLAPPSLMTPLLKIYDGSEDDPPFGCAWGWGFQRQPAPCWYSKITLKGNRNYTTQTPTSTSLSADRLSWLQEEYRSRSVTGSADTDNPEVQEAEWTTHLSNTADLATVAQLNLDLFGVERWYWSFDSLASALALDVGLPAQLFRSRRGMQAGWPGLVWSVDMSTPARGKVQLWG